MNNDVIWEVGRTAVTVWLAIGIIDIGKFLFFRAYFKYIEVPDNK